MNMPEFTAELAISNGPSFFHTSAVGADRTPGDAIAMAFTCPEECPCVCGQGPYSGGKVIRNQTP
jgi:hypothetical protein